MLSRFFNEWSAWCSFSETKRRHPNAAEAQKAEYKCLQVAGQNKSPYKQTTVIIDVLW